MSEELKVEIEYGGGWGYGTRYRELANAIKASISEAHVSGFVGRRTSFEVKLNGEEIYSKLETTTFPEFEEIVQACLDSIKVSLPPTPVQPTKPKKKKIKALKCNIV